MTDHPFGPPPTSPPTGPPGAYGEPVAPPPGQAAMPVPVGAPLSGVPAPTHPEAFGGQAPAPPDGSGVDGRRPWWGMGDILLSLPFILVVALIGTFAGAVFTSGDEFEGMIEGGAVPIAMLATGLIGQQLAQGVWPIIVSKWKGLGSSRDWKLSFSVPDVGIGILVGGAMLVVAGIAAFVAELVVGLDDASEADNTQFIDDARGTPWLWVLIAAVVIGAPVAEEIFFRGLTLRAIEKRAGTVWAVIGSTIIFTLPHFIGAGWQGTVVLFSAIGSVGAILGVLAVKRDNLTAPITAHMLFNSVGALAALGVIEEPESTSEGLVRVLYYAPW